MNLIIKICCYLGIHVFTLPATKILGKLKYGKLSNSSYAAVTTEECINCGHKKEISSRIYFDQPAVVMPIKEIDQNTIDQIKGYILENLSVREIVKLTNLSESTVRRRIKQIENQPGYQKQIFENELN